MAHNSDYLYKRVLDFLETWETRLAQEGPAALAQFITALRELQAALDDSYHERGH